MEYMAVREDVMNVEALLERLDRRGTKFGEPFTPKDTPENRMREKEVYGYIRRFNEAHEATKDSRLRFKGDESGIN